VVFKDGSIAEYQVDLLEANNSSSPVTPSSLLPSWIQGESNVTLFLNHMAKPFHGKLYLQPDHTWSFCTGKTFVPNKSIHIPDLADHWHQYMESGQLFKGHTKFTKVYQARAQVQLWDCVLRNVSAHGLESVLAPTSLKHHSKLSAQDRIIWDQAYDEEFDGLSSLPTWDIVSEEQFKRLSKGVKALPTMAIAMIKYDEYNKPKRAKYRIVVLGNLDFHDWSKADTAAPVLSQLELRLLTSLAVHHRRVLKNCDVKQAFVQSSLPEHEVYYCKPPAGCQRSPPGSYWRLRRSLYGLRRAPKLWFDKLSSQLKAMGLHCSPTSPCLFTGILIEGEPPLNLGIYVDDIVYFSASDKVERFFEDSFSNLWQVDLMGQVTHFLGLEFNWYYHPDGNLSVNLTQQSFAETLIDSVGFVSTSVSTFTSPYRSGFPVDAVPTQPMDSADRDKLRLQYQTLVGSLNWLAHSTRPDLSTIVSLLAQHQSCPSPGHYEAALYVVKYLANTKTLGLHFTSNKRTILEAFLHFPVSPSLLMMSDANWGPQDATQSKTVTELEPFASRSMSAYYVDLYGPLHWSSKRQSITANSSAEAKMYAPNECVKFLNELIQLFDFLQFRETFMPGTQTVYTDNQACVNWSKRCTTKGLHHIQMKENCVRENIASGFIEVCHVDGKTNLADLFTKEMKDTTHFVMLHDLMMCSRNSFP